MLEGKELLEKTKLLSKKSEDEIARGCGYVGPVSYTHLTLPTKA